MIEDPENPNQALDEDGHMNFAVMAAPLGPDGQPVGEFRQIGWTIPMCFRCHSQHPMEVPCSRSPG